MSENNNTKIFKSRFQQKCETTANWEKAVNFIPLKGEVVIYQDFNEDGTPISPQFKVGDGKTYLSELPFLYIIGVMEEGQETGSIQQVGSGALANGRNSIALGKDAIANESNSIALGYSALATEEGAIAIGKLTKALGNGAMATGEDTEAIGSFSYAGGLGTKATIQSQTVIGTYNAEDNDALFIIGKGDSDTNRSNIFVIKKDSTAFLGDKSIVTFDLLTLERGEGENSIQQTEVSAKALTANSVAIGENSRAGCKGYYIVAINFDNNTIFLTDEFPSITYCKKDEITTKYIYSEEEPGYIEETIPLLGADLDASTLAGILEVNFITGDIGYDINTDITFIVYGHRVNSGLETPVSYHYYSAAKISQIDTDGTVTLTLNSESWPFTSIIPVNREHSWYSSVIAPSQPEIGAVEIKQGAISLGGGLSVSESSVATGKDTQAIGDYSLAGGIGAKSGYASVSIGANTSAMGVAAAAFGDRSNASGSYSVAAGYDNEASGTASVAFGSQTEATAQAAFAEGFDTHATNIAAHTEGRGTRASGEYSHAENLNTIAEGNYSHAEGNGSHAKANGSHAEGVDTHANTYCSHTEGQGTVASAQWQHVQGKFNVENTGMAHIIGWGDSKENPKNIHTVDRSGNAWYAGDVMADKISLKNTNATAENAKSIANTAKEAADTANNKINSLNIKNADTFNIRQINAEIVKGINNAAAFGTSHIVGGNYSFAEGFQTTNLGSHAHIEGSSNNTAAQAASNYNSSYTPLDINVSNVEQIWGLKQFALSNGKGAHVEGWNNIAIGEASHAEGYGTMALADYAHASGEGTRATVQAQTVVGKYNQKDAEALFIVGNGDGFSNSQRKNAFAVKKDGSIQIGETILTEEKLKSLIALLETAEQEVYI